MPFVRADEIDIYYEVHGEGEPLLLIMGFTGTTEMWFRQLPELSRRYRVIAFDNRGSGRSDKPDVPYTMQMLTLDAACLLDALHVEQAHVYGVSMGGMIAQNLALLYPDRVLSLVLGCTSCGGGRFVLPEDGTIDFLMNWHRRDEVSPEERTRETLPYSLSQRFIDNNPEIVEQYISRTLEYWPPLYSFKRQAEAVLTHDTYDLLPRIKVPTLVISGGADRQVPVENSKILASRIPGARLVVLEGAGHAFFVEAAEQANTAILDFLGRQTGS